MRHTTAGNCCATLACPIDSRGPVKVHQESSSELPLATRDGIDESAVLIFLGIEAARQRFSFFPYDRAIHARKLLVLADEQLRGWDRLLVRAMFGFSELRMPCALALRRDVSLLWLPHRSSRTRSGKRRTPDLLRQLVSFAHARNRRLARMCRCLVGEATDVGFSEIVSKTPCAPRARVVLLPESVEHAAQLALTLPSWVVLALPDAHLDGMSERHRRVLRSQDALTSCEARRRIVTFSATELIDWSRVDVLVRADAGIGLPPIPRAALRIPASRRIDPLIVVDVDDRRDRMLQEMVVRRRHAYVGANWFDVGADPELERLKIFIKEIQCQ